MRSRFWLLPLFLSGTLTIQAGDTNCPAYPTSQREADSQRLAQLKAFARFSIAARARQATRVAPRMPASNNFIDDAIFGKMSADGVAPAPLTSDAEYLRRVSLDLTGRIPPPDAVDQFLQNGDPNKRANLVDQLMASDEFTDNWTLFYSNLFQVTSRYYNFITINGRNQFHGYLREFVQNDRSYQTVARELISASGDGNATGPVNFVTRAYQQGDPVQDTWDTLADQITVGFMGTKSICISCHDGRGHLEQINLFLSTHRRQQFWGLSAFLSRMNTDFLPMDAFHQQYYPMVVDRTSGAYSTIVPTSNPGQRPARSGGPYTPSYLYSGETPANGNWRAEFARIVSSDRQLARASVNYIWAHMFTYGIVDPPDAWDMARIDAKNPPPDPWALQATNPDLMEALASEFIANNYSIRHMIRLMALSNAYQLSSNYPGAWNPVYANYFAKHFPRRLSAEEIYDAVSDATLTGVPMYLDGYSAPIYHAQQLPDPTEPRNNGSITTLLGNFGRGDYWTVPRNSTSTVLQVLYLMNDFFVNFRTFGTGNGSWNSRVGQLLESQPDDKQAVGQLFRATLGRPPSDDEMASVIKRRSTLTRDQWLSDVQWSLLNKLDFIFNY